MCSQLKISNKIINPGSLVTINVREGTDVKIWGIDDIYNARVESKDTFWKSFKPCYVGIEGFYEGKGLFISTNGVTLPLNAAGLYNEHSVVILTRPSIGTPVEKFHKRSIVLLNLTDIYKYINFRLIHEIDYSLIKNIA